RRPRPDVDDQRDLRPRQLRAAPAKDLSDSPAQAISRHGVARAPGHGDPQPRTTGGPAIEKKHLQMASGRPDPRGVALFEFSSLSKAVVAGEGLPDGPARDHTESLLRPLRRRAEITARPERVRIRTRKPCVRLRRRLLG